MTSRFEQTLFARRAPLFLVALSSLVLSAARASAQTEVIRIEYRALPGCPSSDEFNAEVFKRTSSARLAATEVDVRTFVVEIEQRKGSLTGSLRVREGRTETVAREVQGERCSELASALALATALAIDPNASFDAPSNENGATSEPKADASGGAAKTDPKQASKPAPSADATRLDGGVSTPASSPKGAGWSLALGPSLLTGVTPRVAVGGSLAAERNHYAANAWLSSYGAELTLLRGLESDAEGASVAFQFVHARPAACSMRLGAANGVSVSPCLGAELGVLSGWGSDIAREESHTKLWSALDAFVKLRFMRPSSWLVEAQAGAVFPLTRYDFVFLDPRTPVHSVPWIAFAAGLRIGVPLGH